ncbi:septal ring lytic transglycosylase RlpA family protein [Flavobacterium sp. JP2137]|uniref:septal ring lytic transglycosylase RlpA family protein n=1 Tax=Flavobacterium sp. JP2137 TaxID=3414510 RepID=UPI003D300F62
MGIFKSLNSLKWVAGLSLIAVLILSSCSASRGKATTKVYKKKAKISYYHDKFNGKSTASGEVFSNKKPTAAHKTLPFGTRIRVTNTANNKSVDLKVNDRGPFTRGRELDVSKKAFMDITDNKNHGVLEVLIELIN